VSLSIGLKGHGCVLQVRLIFHSNTHTHRCPSFWSSRLIEWLIGGHTLLVVLSAHFNQDYKTSEPIMCRSFTNE